MKEFFKNAKELHSHEKVVCFFSILIAIILLINVIVDLIHIGISSSNHSALDRRVEVLEQKIEDIENHLRME